VKQTFDMDIQTRANLYAPLKRWGQTNKIIPVISCTLKIKNKVNSKDHQIPDHTGV